MDSNISKLAIANKSLYKIGAKRLSSFNDGSPNSIIINDIYATCLEELLEEHTWSFAVQAVPLATLALSVALPVMNDGIQYAYGLPADFIDVYMLSQPAFYRIETVKPPYVASATVALLSDQATISGMRYVFNNDDPTTYTAKFIEALSTKLALECCFKISEAAALVGAMEGKYQKALISAISVDSNNSSPDQSIANEWFIARLAGSGAVSGLPNGNIGFFPDPYNPEG